MILIDKFQTNKNRKSDGKEIKLEAEQVEGVPLDVINHVNEVKRAAENTDEEYQIKAVDLCKVYGSGKKAV